MGIKPSVKFDRVPVPIDRHDTKHPEGRVLPEPLGEGHRQVQTQVGGDGPFHVAVDPDPAAHVVRVDIELTGPVSTLMLHGDFLFWAASTRIPHSEIGERFVVHDGVGRDNNTGFAFLDEGDNVQFVTHECSVFGSDHRAFTKPVLSKHFAASVKSHPIRQYFSMQNLQKLEESRRFGL